MKGHAVFLLLCSSDCVVFLYVNLAFFMYHVYCSFYIFILIGVTLKSLIRNAISVTFVD